jgi:hypothetical protein
MLYRVHWHEIKTGRRFMSAPMSLEQAQEMIADIMLDDTIISDGIKPVGQDEE